MIQTLFNILLIVIGFGVLIFIHELGHFLAAKWAGIRAEAFAVGMGPVAMAWRKGIGLRFSSTERDVDARLRQHFDAKGVSLDMEQGDRIALRKQVYQAMDDLGIGETEYSLRWLPIGGFVKMLGQEDANPNAVSDDPRSYNMRPIGKRMVVVSAGVIMNLILAIILFIIAFMVGVRFPAAVVGDVSPLLAAGRTMPVNAASAGVTAAGLLPGDRVISIDGSPAKTFADIQIAAAMARPESVLQFIVERPGVSEPLTFRLEPRKDPATGLLGIGIAPGASTKLAADDSTEAIAALLERLGLAGVQPGMTLLSVNGADITTFGQVAHAARNSHGQALRTQWASIDQRGERGPTIDATLNVFPDFEQYRQRETSADDGLAGFSHLMRVARVPDDSRNKDVLRTGDVLVRIADVPFPRQSQVYDTLRKHRRSDIDVIVLRDGEQVPVTCHVNKNGQLRIEIAPAEDMLITAQPVSRFARYRTDDPTKTEEVSTPAGRLGLFSTGGTRIVAVGEREVQTWAELREAITDATSAAIDSESGAKVELTVVPPPVGSSRETVMMDMTADEVRRLHGLGWHVRLPSVAFEPLYTVRKGSPAQALTMGFEETHKMVMMTYLTIDRLIRGSVGVDQLRGPVGIVHIGTKVAREGFMYLLFFLGMISVNLAVINFLPLPIVDGGLFLFLVYEKIKGRPPSLAFQNIATVVGLLIIGTLFVVTFYNDVLRLFT